MSRFGLVVGLIVCAGFVAACSPKPEASPDPASAAEKSAADKTSTAKATQLGNMSFPVRTMLDGWNGNWVLLVHEEQKDYYVCVLSLAVGPSGDVKAEIIDNTQILPGLELTGAKAKDNSLEISFNTASGPGDVQAQLVDGFARGSFLPSGALIRPAKIVPIDGITLKGYTNPNPTDGTDVFKKALTSKQPTNALMAFAREFPQNPLSIDAFQGVLARAAATRQDYKFDAESFAEFTESHFKAAATWGPRFLAYTKFITASHTAYARKFPSRGLELLNESEAELAATNPDNQRLGSKETFAALRESLTNLVNLERLASPDENIAKSAAESLVQAATTQRYNAEMLATLGEYFASHDQPAEAIPYLSTLVAMPLLEQMVLQDRIGLPPGDPTPRELLAKLWQESHADGPADSLDVELARVYESQMRQLTEEATAAVTTPVPAADAGNRVALVELFTGQACPPCVGAEVATLAIRHSLPEPRVISLAYHQHIPLPDPLTNQDNEDRFAFYEAAGAPTLAVNGKLVQPSGGYLSHGPSVYAALRLPVDKVLQSSTTATISLSATASDGELMVTASAKPPEGTDASAFRLRLALVENQIAFPSANGIRQHHNVVRGMLGGQKGTGPKGDEFKYQVTLKLDDFRAELVDFLTKFEEGRNFQFALKPIQLSPLSLVGWLQNDQTKEIVQAAIVPVEGELVFSDK